MTYDDKTRITFAILMIMIGLAFHGLNDHKRRIRVLEERAGIAAEGSNT